MLVSFYDNMLYYRYGENCDLFFEKPDGLFSCYASTEKDSKDMYKILKILNWADWHVISYY
jgi:hypothetical protein